MPTDTALRLEQRGLAATWSGLRVAYAAGGDGESDTRVDLRNFAAFVRDPTALVTCLLLPHCCSVRLEMQVRQTPSSKSNITTTACSAPVYATGSHGLRSCHPEIFADGIKILAIQAKETKETIDDYATLDGAPFTPSLPCPSAVHMMLDKASPRMRISSDCCLPSKRHHRYRETLAE